MLGHGSLASNSFSIEVYSTNLYILIIFEIVVPKLKTIGYLCDGPNIFMPSRPVKLIFCDPSFTGLPTYIENIFFHQNLLISSKTFYSSTFSCLRKSSNLSPSRVFENLLISLYKDYELQSSIHIYYHFLYLMLFYSHLPFFLILY